MGLIAIVVNVSLIGIYSRIGWVIFRQTKLNKKFSNANIVSKSSTPEATLSGLQTTVVKDSSRTNLGEKERYNDRMIKCIPLNQNTNNTVKKNVRNTRKYEMKLDQHAKINKNIMHKFTLMFMLITFIFLICYIPKIVIMIVEALNPTFWEDLSDSGRAAMFFVYRMYIINNIANPFVYAFLDTQFKSNLKHLCSCCVRTREN